MEMQKALHLHIEESKKKPKLQGTYMLSEKLDGWWIGVEYTPLSGWGYPFTSAGRILPSLMWMKHEVFKYLQPKQRTILIAEATIPGLGDFHTLGGILNRSIGNCSCKDVQLNLHDLIYPNNNKSAIERYTDLQGLQEYLNKWLRIHNLLLVSEYNKKLWLDTFNTVINADGEGIVCKRTTDIYQFGEKNSSLLKIKLEKSFDLLCIGFYETIGEKGNINYNILAKRKNEVLIPVRVGKHKDIENFLKASPIGKVVEIKAMCELPDGSLREPRFKRLRPDKTINEIN